MIQSPLTPKPIVFKVVWPILYTTILYSMFNIKGTYCMLAFIIQIILNVIWTYMFFTLKLYTLSFLSIGVMIGAVIYLISACNQKILIPYVMWLSFALYLSGYVMLYN